MHVEREGGLLAWQWRGYAEAHRDRANLLLHMLGVPVFIRLPNGAVASRPWTLGSIPGSIP